MAGHIVSTLRKQRVNRSGSGNKATRPTFSTSFPLGKLHLLKVPLDFPNTTPSWRPSVPICEPTGDNFQSQLMVLAILKNMASRVIEIL